MIPRTLWLRNFMCYREPGEPLSFDGLHVICLVGDNGAGKSALLDAITWALWGEARRPHDDMIALGAPDMFVEFEFELERQRYRVRRDRTRGSGKSPGTSQLVFSVWDASRSDYRSISEGTISATQERIDQTLRMRYDTFINASFLLQGRADEFTRKPPAERKKVLAEILGLGLYEDLEQRAKKRAAGFDGQLKVLEGQIEATRARSEQRETFERLVQQARERVERLDYEVQQLRQQVQTQQQHVQKLEERRERRNELQQRIESSQREAEEFRAQAGRKRNALAEAEQVLARQEQIEAGLASLKAARARLELLDAQCDQYEELVRQVNEYTAEIEREAIKLEQARTHAATRLADLQQRAAQQEQLAAGVRALDQQLAALDRREDELQAARSRRDALSTRTEAIAALRLQHERAKAAIEAARRDLVAQRDSEYRAIQQLERQVRDEEALRREYQAALAAVKRLRELRERQAVLDEAERADGERVGELRAERERLKTEGTRIREKLTMLQHGERACPLCGEPLGPDGLARVLRDYEREREDLVEQYRTTDRGVKTLEQSLVQIRSDRQALDQEIHNLQGRAAQASQLQERLDDITQTRVQIDQARAVLNQIEVQLGTGDYASDERSVLAGLEAELAALDPDGLENARAELDAQIKALDVEVRRRADLAARVAALRKDLESASDAAAQVADAREALDELQRTLAGQTYALNARAARATLQSEIAALGYTPEEHKRVRREAQELQRWEQEHQRLEATARSISQLHADVEQAEASVRRRVEAIAEDEREIARLDQELKELPAARHALMQTEGQLRIQEDELQVSNRQLGDHQRSLADAERAADELKAHLERQRALQDQQALYRELAEACGKKGVQAMLIETAIPEIEREANGLLSRITDSQMHLTFETRGATKRGDPTETLEIKIADTVGTRDYDSFSGGEAFRVNFAVRVALSRLLARRAGASLETLVVDEGFGTLDAVGRERIVEAISAIQHDFRRILVVTHLQELKDMFDTQIEVRRTPEGSVWSVV